MLGCKKDNSEKSFISGDDLNLEDINIEEFDTLELISVIKDPQIASLVNSKPTTRAELENMKTVVQLFNGKKNKGISIPGFGGLKLGKKESNLNVYYVETKKVIIDSDTILYGIGYSVHYLFKKVKKGIEITNLPKVAASAQLENGKTSVNYSLQTYGMRSQDLVNFFKPQVNSNFNVDGFAIIQSSIDGIHNILADSLLSARTKFTPEELKWVKPNELN